jgi:sulfur-oxidizing protein SoxB
MTLLKTGKPIEADRDYVIAGWASINEDVEGPPIWDVVMNHVSRVKTIEPAKATHVKVTGA